MNTKHAPGPWKIGQRKEHDDYWSAIIRAADQYAVAKVGGSTLKECEANARLIAAAPELLESLKYIVDQRESTPNKNVYEVGHVSIERAKSAIAKTEGVN